MFFKKIPQNSVRLITNNGKFFKSTVAILWTHQIALCHQPCHRGFTAKITDSPNMVCTVKHTTEGLQHNKRIPDFTEYCSLHCHVKMESSEGKREKTRMAEGTVQSDFLLALIVQYP